MTAINRKPNTQTKQDVEKFVVRLPKGMRDRIGEVSRLSRRSMNSEIVARLEESLGESWTADTVHEPQGQWSTGTPILRSVESQAGDQAQEAQLLARFRLLSDDKRRAILDLLG